MASSSGCALVVGAPSSPGAAGRAASVSPPERADANRSRFPRSCRLTHRKQYLEVYRQGRRVPSRTLTLFGLPNASDQCRLGITATRKVGSAVRRNRVKRMLRDVFRRHRHELAPGLDVVVNAHPGLHERSVAEVEQEFLKTFARLARATLRTSR